jgi:ATP-binding cassette subfamily B protein
MSAGYHIEDEVHQRAFDATLMRRLLGYVRPYRGWMLFATLLLLLVALLSNALPVLIMLAVDVYIGENHTPTAASALFAAPGPMTPQQKMDGLLWITLLITSVIFAEAVLRYLQLIIVSIIGQRTMMEMRVQLFDHLQQMSLRFLDRNPVGRLMSRVTNDVEKIQQTIVSGVVNVISDGMTAVVVLVFMFYLNWRLACIALIPVPFIFVTSMLFRKYAQHSFLEIRKKIGALSAVLQENIAGMRIVQLFRQEARKFAEYAERNAEHRDEWLRQVRNFALYFPVVEFLGTFSTALIILYTGVAMLQLGYEEMRTASVGTMFAFVFLAERFFAPIRGLADHYNLLLEAMASSERVFQLLDTRPEILDPAEAVPCTRLEGRVEFRNVWFAYEGEQWVLRDVSFSIAPGERLAIVGHTGAGKSTIINLLSRFYDVQRGSVLIDGVDVRRYRQADLRRHIGIVLQDVFLFSGSIADNIRLGDSTMSEDHVRACAAYVNAARFIERLPEGYDYAVGERGCNLSTGQRQLLAFARTLAHDPQVLVLDEATASVDTETERLIQDGIHKLMEGRTSIVIAHRLSTIQHADRILVLHHGEVREEGTHQELLALNGLYRTLYELQYKDQDVGGNGRTRITNEDTVHER